MDSFGRTTETYIEREIRTQPNASDKLTKGKKIFVLTSDQTYSAAEDHIYNLKKLRPEVTIIGNQTRGGATSIGPQIGNDYYWMDIPVGLMIDKKRNYTYNIKGITPDIKCDPDSAVSGAYSLATQGEKLRGDDKILYLQNSKEPTRVMYTDAYKEKCRHPILMAAS